MLDYEDQLSELYGEKAWFLKQSIELSPLIRGWFRTEQIEVRNGSLAYKPAKRISQENLDQKVMRQEIFGGFLRLAEAQDEEILDYARRWGILGLCHHGLPVAHEMKPYSWSASEKGCNRRKRGGWFYEPLERWRYYSRQMSAAVRLAVDLRKDEITEEEQRLVLALKEKDKAERWRAYESFEALIKIAPVKTKKPFASKVVVEISPRVPGKREDWHIVFQGFEEGFSLVVPFAISAGRFALSTVINRWLGLTGIRPYFLWSMSQSDFTLSSSAYEASLLPVLAVQLMLIVNGSPDYAICYSCCKPFFLRKGQRLNQRCFCKECGTKAARREATKRYYNQEKKNSDRPKRKRLTQPEVKAIQRALKKNRPGLVQELAQKYGVTKWAIYKIREEKPRKQTD